MTFADGLRDNYCSSDEEWAVNHIVKEITYAVMAAAHVASTHATSLEGYLSLNHEGGYAVVANNPSIYLYKDANYLKYEKSIDTLNSATPHAPWSMEFRDKIFNRAQAELKKLGFKNISISAEDKTVPLTTRVTMFNTDVKKKFLGFSIHISVSW
jgi:hypothetical protein